MPGDDSHLHELVHGIPPSTVDNGLTDNPVELLTGELRHTIAIMCSSQENTVGCFPVWQLNGHLSWLQLQDRFRCDNHCLLYPQLPELNCLQLSEHCYPVPIETSDIPKVLTKSH